MRNWESWWLWPLTASDRMRRALRRYWKRILVGAFVGWFYTTVGGAFGLALLEFWGLVSPSTSDSLGIVTVLSGVAFGGVIAYAGRPSSPSAMPESATVPAEAPTATRHRP